VTFFNSSINLSIFFIIALGSPFKFLDSPTTISPIPFSLQILEIVSNKSALLSKTESGKAMRPPSSETAIPTLFKP
jgi:hypothetical protein